MPLYFITSNPGKLREVKAILPNIEQLDLDLDEIQSLDSQTVIEHKLAQAARQHEGVFFVEDTAATLNCLGSLPGTYIKAFEQSLGLAGIAALAAKYDDQSGFARTTIGYRDTEGDYHYFVGEIKGTVVAPRGSGFGWDSIFVPEGYDQTLAELGREVKQRISMRAKAVQKLADHLRGTHK